MNFFHKNIILYFTIQYLNFDYCFETVIKPEQPSTEPHLFDSRNEKTNTLNLTPKQRVENTYLDYGKIHTNFMYVYINPNIHSSIIIDNI
jgi:hypothetical protein